MRSYKHIQPDSMLACLFVDLYDFELPVQSQITQDATLHRQREEIQPTDQHANILLLLLYTLYVNLVNIFILKYSLFQQNYSRCFKNSIVATSRHACYC